MTAKEKARAEAVAAAAQLRRMTGGEQVDQDATLYPVAVLHLYRDHFAGVLTPQEFYEAVGYREPEIFGHKGDQS